MILGDPEDIVRSLLLGAFVYEMEVMRHLSCQLGDFVIVAHLDRNCLVVDHQYSWSNIQHLIDLPVVSCAVVLVVITKHVYV